MFRTIRNTLAAMVIGVFFFMSLQMIFIGIVGEYIGTIHTLVQRRPLVIEQERINFEYPPGEPLCDAPPNGSHVGRSRDC